MMKVELVLPVSDELGEGPLWHPTEQALYWVDIELGRYHCYDPRTGAHEIVEVGGKLGALGFCADGGLVLATDHGFSFFDPATHVETPIGDPEADRPETRFNDGAVDRAGRFWAGTLGGIKNNHLYRLDPDGSIQRMESGIAISNGIGWSPDNRVMYYVDSIPGLIYAYDFDLPGGSISNRRVFVDRSAKPGVPDGLTVDAEGYLWVAVWEGSCIEVYDPQGRLVRTVPMPVVFPTSLAFGGADLTDLYITSAKVEIPAEEREKSPLAGNLFVIRNAGKGLPEPMFAGKIGLFSIKTV
jgi:sugar lactone lactonase YvrE